MGGRWWSVTCHPCIFGQQGRPLPTPSWGKKARWCPLLWHTTGNTCNRNRVSLPSGYTKSRNEEQCSGIRPTRKVDRRRGVRVMQTKEVIKINKYCCHKHTTQPLWGHLPLGPFWQKEMSSAPHGGDECCHAHILRRTLVGVFTGRAAVPVGASCHRAAVARVGTRLHPPAGRDPLGLPRWCLLGPLAVA